MDRKIGLIAGGGDLPVRVAAALHEGDESPVIVTLSEGLAEGPLARGVHVPLTKFSALLKTFKREGVTHICMAGTVDRPDFKTFRPDMKAMRFLPGVISAARKGDDALLREVMSIFEREGFQIISAQDLCAGLLVSDGTIGAVRLTADMRLDALKAMQVAAEIGRLDIGQGVVVADGVVLAVEAQEGTDRMLRRVASIRGEYAERSGVLAKRLKPGQDDRVDLPTIGPETVRLCAEAGLAGILVEAGQAFIMDRDEAVRLADEAGLFIVGLPPTTPAQTTPEAPESGSL